MRRPVVAAAGLVIAGAGVLPTLAAQPADSGRTAGMSVRTRLPNGDALTLNISAMQLSDGNRLVVDATRCDADGSCTARPYAAALSDGAFSIDPADPVATLRATLDGRPLVITWQPQTNGGYAVGSGLIEGDDSGLFATDFAGTSADATVSFDGQDCDGVGGVGTGVVVDATADGSQAAPLSALSLPEGTRFRC